MNIIRTNTEKAPAHLFDRRFTVDHKLVLSLQDDQLTYNIVPVVPYQRDIHEQDNDYGFDENEPVVFFAQVDGAPAGRVRMISWWNGFAYVDDLVVNPIYRGRGIGRALLELGIKWAREKGYPGVMLETQHDNVNACRLYKTCGFVLGGFDRSVYRALHANPETALYWYLVF